MNLSYSLQRTRSSSTAERILEMREHPGRNLTMLSIACFFKHVNCKCQSAGKNGKCWPLNEISSCLTCFKKPEGFVSCLMKTLWLFLQMASDFRRDLASCSRLHCYRSAEFWQFRLKWSSQHYGAQQPSAFWLGYWRSRTYCTEW